MGLGKKLKKKAKKAVSTATKVTGVGAKIARTVGPIGSVAPPPFGTLVAAGSTALISADTMAKRASKLIGSGTSANGKVDSAISDGTTKILPNGAVIRTSSGKSIFDLIFEFFGL